MRQSYRFGEFVIDLPSQRLLGEGKILHLEPRVFELLVYLLRHRERIVGKEELVSAVWDEAFVSDGALTQAIARLRRALGDDAQQPRWIETAHTRGYRFIGEVEERVEAPLSAAGTVRTTWWLGGTLLAASAVIAGWLLWVDRDRGSGSLRDEPEVRSLAILPLRALPADPEHGYLAEGLHELLVTELASAGPLRVISRQSTLAFRDPGALPVSQIASRLGVEAVIQGSLIRSGETVEISVQLIDGASEEHLWARAFTRDSDEVLALLGDLAAAIADEIGLALNAEDRSRLAIYGTGDWRAQQAYLQARYLLHQAEVPAWSESARRFEETIAFDPDFAPAHSGLAIARALPAFFGLVPFAGVAPGVEEAAARAIELDPRLAEGHSALAFVRLYHDRDFETARREIELAIELNPSDAFVRHGYGDYLTVVGRLEEGLEQVRIGRQCDPLSRLTIAPVVGHLLFVGRFEEAVEEARNLLELDPRFFLARSFLFQGLWHLGRDEEAIAILREDWQQRDPEALMALEHGWQQRGPKGAMLAIAELLAGRYESQPWRGYDIARYEALGGAPDAAFAHLEQAFAARAPKLLHLEVDPDFDSLREHPRYRDLVRRIGFPTGG